MITRPPIDPPPTPIDPPLPVDLTSAAVDSTPLAWMVEGLPFNALGASLKRRFGGRVQRVSLDAGLTCPNVDGTLVRGGCNFCDNRSFSPSRRVRLARIRDQMAAGIESVRRRYKNVRGFIAYFQPATNTYARIDELAEMYDAALNSHDDVVGLAIGTRPDCVPDAVLDLLSDLSRRHHVSIEYGMQTASDRSLRWMNRAHVHADMINAADRTRPRTIEMGAHIILGVPGEDHVDMMRSAEAVVELGVDSVKIHNLYAVEGTALGDQVRRGEIEMMPRDQYIETVVDFIERLPPRVVVERISGDAPPKYLIAPLWCLEKSTLRLSIEATFQRRGTVQGSRYVPPAIDPVDRVVPPDQTPEAIRRQIQSKGRLPVLKIEAQN